MDISKRNINDDCIRLIAMIMVIIIHVNYEDVITNPWLKAAIMTVVSCSNCFFFILSGKYNLRINPKPGEEIKEITRFYKKKFIDILFPFVTISMLLSIWNYVIVVDAPMTFKSYMLFAMKELFSENATKHMWFMYPLLGYILSTPFLARMLHSMRDGELHILMIVGLIWNTVTIIFQDTEHTFGYYGWLMSGWIVYYIAGYYLDRVMNNNNHHLLKALMICGSIGLAVNVCGMVLLPENYYSYSEYTDPFLMFAIGLFVFLEQKIRISGNVPVRIISMVVKHSFTIYLVHYSLLNYLIVEYVCFDSVALQFTMRVVVTLLLSFAVACVIDYVLALVKKPLRRVLHLT
ncbi:MAG: acyltransferase [Lachnospiraceae bacterium]|nr:acyltransferase [Lachnospiraceae bacterium]